jgi:hypothetical protein
LHYPFFQFLNEKERLLFLLFIVFYDVVNDAAISAAKYSGVI